LQSQDVSYALLGQGIAWQLGADPQDIFQQMLVYVPKRGETDVLNPEGSFTKSPVRLAGVFSVQEEIDNKVVLVPLQFLRPLLERQTAISAIEIKFKPNTSSDKVVQAIKEVAGSELKVLGRYEQREGFYKVLKSEKLMSYIILFFILLIASTNAIGSLYILVMGKKKDIKMLSALGLTNGEIASVYKWSSLFIAIAGGGLGMLAGICIAKLQEVYGFVKLSKSADFISIAYPVQLRPADLIQVAATIISIGFVAALYPAAKARQMAQIN
jgi:ABC-type lipoprotein release transport system permease subunit